VFELDPILWLQSWESPVLTGVMNGISLLGYTRAFVVFATVLVFGFGQRAAIALLVVIALNGALTDIAKTAVATPRPDWVEGQVRALSTYAERLRGREPDSDTEMEDTYGFPSGHVSATTAFLVGAALLFNWRRRGWTLAVSGIAVMAVALVLSAGALLVGLPDAGDVGRLLGTATGVLFLVESRVFEFARSRSARALLVGTAGAAFGAAWWVMTWLLNDLQPSGVSAMRLAVSALPNATLLVVPTWIPRMFAWRRRVA